MSYARISDFYINYSSSSPFTPGSGLALISKLALYDRSGQSLLIALPTWIAGAQAKAFLYPINLLFTPVLIISSYLILKRLSISTPVLVITLSILALNNFFLFHAYGSYAGKAIGIPLFVATLHIMYDTLRKKAKKRELFLAALMSSAVAVTYWELAPIAILFYLGIVSFSLTKKRFFRLIKRSVIILILIAIVAPNFPSVLIQSIQIRYKQTTSEINPYWSKVKVEPYLLFMAGLHGRLPSVNSAATKIDAVDQGPKLWTEMNRDSSTKQWRANRYQNSEDYYLSWRFLLLLSILIPVALIAFNRQNKYFTCISRFTLIGGVGFLLSKPESKIFFNFLAYLTPFIIITWAAGLDLSYKFLLKRARWALCLLFAPILFFIIIESHGTSYMIASTIPDTHTSELYTKKTGQYYRYLESIKTLSSFIRTNFSSDKKIIFMDDQTEEFKSGWGPVQYWLYYELKDFEMRFFEPGPHFSSQKVLSPGDLKDSLLIYMSPYKINEVDPVRFSAVIFRNDNFMVSTEKLKTIPYGFAKRPATVERWKSFDGKSSEFLSMRNSFDMSTIKDFTIEMWIKPGSNSFPKNSPSLSPPMPAIIEPLAIYQTAEGKFKLEIRTENKESLYYLFDKNLPSRWFHLEVAYDSINETIVIFVNGELVKVFNNSPLKFAGNILLGKGMLNRFWTGQIGELRISRTVRHSRNFTPQTERIKLDDKTLYLN
ncbi:MAG: LamG-like jellyroll fold domain-containing protein [Thermodesulfobacteriota bacterium]